MSEKRQSYFGQLLDKIVCSDDVSLMRAKKNGRKIHTADGYAFYEYRGCLFVLKGRTTHDRRA